MPATLVVTATPNMNSMEDMQAYLSGVTLLLIANGGELVYRGKTSKMIKGSPGFDMVLIMSFENQEVIEKIFNSAEYAVLLPLCDKGFKHIDISVTLAM
jgi:uncharacterized protein (DUF1330 family)